MSEHELRGTREAKMTLWHDGEVCCSACGYDRLEWRDMRASADEQSVLIRTRCERCTRVADLHVVWSKGSILTRWYSVAERSDFDGPVEPM